MVLARDFPYASLRPGQRELAEAVAKTVREGRVLAVQAPTGYGKTVAILKGLMDVKELDKKIVYVVRTRNEIQPVIRELSRLKANYTFLFSAKRMCPLLTSTGEEDVENFWENCRLARLAGLCEYYANLEEADEKLIETLIRESNENPFLTVQLLASYKICPFFSLKRRIADAKLVVATYPYVFNPDIFQGTLEPLDYSDIVLVVDEAHSLLEAHTMLEKRLSMTTLRNAAREVERHIGKDTTAYQAIQRLYNYLKNTRAREIVKADKKLLAEIIGDPGDWDEIATEIRLAVLREKLDTQPQQSLNVNIATSRLAAFAALAVQENVNIYVQQTGESAKELIAVPSDPCIVTKEPLNRAHAVILSSGTLPPANYLRDILCIERRITVYDVELVHGVKPYWGNYEALLILDVTSRYSERSREIYERYADYITVTLQTMPGAVLAVYPSYEFMKNIVSFLKHNVDCNIIVEEPGTRISDVVQQLEESNCSLINAVASGKLVEGVEYTREGRSIVKTVFIAGVPYPQPDTILKDYIASVSKRLGRAMEKEIYTTLAVTKVRQAIGRVIRGPQDRAVVVLGDRRFLSQSLRSQLRLRIDYMVSSISEYRKVLESLKRVIAG